MTNKRVYGLPTPGSVQNPNAGIAQVVVHLAKYLPEFGYELVETPEQADLIAHHAGNGDGNCDVAHCHGLYPTAHMPDTGSMYYEINRRVIADLRAAKAITVPSQWVADIIRRDMHIEPHVIGWGVNVEDWQHDHEPKGYVLWNKNRPSDVCSPEPMQRLAHMALETPFISTFGDKTRNVSVIGVQPHEVMKTLIQQASVYLATTKETGDIGSREALASGVPVLGFRQGAIVDFVQHGVNGFLAEPGDYDGLFAGLKYCLEHRETLSQNAKKLAQGYSWRDVARGIAAVYDAVLMPETSVKVSVIIPCYNYADFVADAIHSVISQDVDFDFEVIVVNDGSTDKSLDAINTYRNHAKVTIIDQPNSGVAFARNNAIAQARGEYIACLDADDRMKGGWLQACADALNNDKQLGIAYTGIYIMGNGVSGWPGQFDFAQQIQRSNQVPSLCMFRKVWWERAGGYRQHKHPAEDADLWLRMTALGAMARKVTDAPLFEYRMHENSASAPVRRQERDEPDWIGGKGWITSSNFPFAAPTINGKVSNRVRNYDQPRISVIVPVGVGHMPLTRDAFDSIEGQTFPFWEVVAVNDTGLPVPDDIRAAYPFVKWVDTPGKTGAGHARNVGMEHAKGDLFVFLDADDFLMPDFMGAALRLYKQTGNYIYTDWIRYEDGIVHETPPFSPERIFKEGAFHAVTALVPRKEALEARFNEDLSAWEDVDFYMRLIVKGLCGVRLAKPLVAYRFGTGQRREHGAANAETLKPFFTQHYPEYISGEKEIVCTCKKMKTAPNNLGEKDMVEVVYHGQQGNHTLTGFVTRQNYGRREGGQRFFVYAADAKIRPDLFEIVTEIEEDPIETLIPVDPHLV